MNSGVLVDSDVLIWFLRGRKDIIPIVEKLLTENRLFTSPISVAEIIAGAKSNEEKQITEFFNLIEILDIDKSIAVTAGNFIKKYYKSHSVELADAIIAATAKDNKLLLWTLNKKHYPMIVKEKFF